MTGPVQRLSQASGVSKPERYVKVGAGQREVVEVFTSSGTFTPPAGVTEVEVFMVGGGGGASSSGTLSGGGAGAGGVLHQTIRVNGPVLVEIGAGAAHNTNGGATYFGGLSVLGGGQGKGTQDTSAITSLPRRFLGSSTGGGVSSAITNARNPVPPIVDGHGFPGGTATNDSIGGSRYGGAGGGGAGGAGGDQTVTQSGNGGPGVVSLSGVPVAGGGGAVGDPGVGMAHGVGTHGGGNGGPNGVGSPGVPGTGGGGASGGTDVRAGGSGRVEVRYYV